MKNCFNAKDTFLLAVKGQIGLLKCAEIGNIPHFNVPDFFFLPCNYLRSEFDEFLNSIDFVIHADDFYGKIWLIDGSWMEYINDTDNRDSGWEHFECPKIPLQCQKKY